MTKIKICGLFREADIEMVNMLQPEYIGFVFAKSPRRVTAETARCLKRLLSPNIQTVGVFVNEDAHQVADLVHEGVIDMVQLHGDEDDGYLQELKSLVSVPIIKKVAPDADCEGTDYLLFDGASPGSGETFDWELIPPSQKEYFLAGGLNSGNVLAALSKKPYAVDVSSGVEVDGMKDFGEMKKFMERVRSVGG
ncbi:MAG: phosphoribosylanthranilate isomerase [Turicibacter sp.]|nr:phosphoribosylanthranilate isomerase [Turicibacter sp.]